jgi:hypothetical protein
MKISGSEQETNCERAIGLLAPLLFDPIQDRSRAAP